jgi:mannan polymerase II complex MNN11 subunit
MVIKSSISLLLSKFKVPRKILIEAQASDSTARMGSPDGLHTPVHSHGSRMCFNGILKTTLETSAPGSHNRNDNSIAITTTTTTTIMHFALPPRKGSTQPQPFTRQPIQRNRLLRQLSYAVLSLLTLYLLINFLTPNSPTSTSTGDIPPNPTIVIVTVLPPDLPPSYINMLTTNRNDYASRHNYLTFYTNTTTYTDLISPSPSSWTLVPALRHALTLHPTANYIWSLTPHALIMNPTLSLHTNILSPLSQLMQKDIPIVPPDSVIHTHSHLKPQDAHLIISQDIDNLAHTSFLLKHNHHYPGTPPSKPHPDADFAPYLLDAWSDPLLRSYSFHLADLHALEHLVQWHPTITSKLVLIPQRRLNSYNFVSSQRYTTDKDGKEVVREHDSMWGEGDLVVNFKGCAESKDRDCEGEMTGYYKRWQKEVKRLDEAKSTGMNGGHTTPPNA